MKTIDIDRLVRHLLLLVICSCLPHHFAGFEHLGTEELKDRAEEFSNSSFRNHGANGRGFDSEQKNKAFTAWSSMKALQHTYCYVHGWSNPKKWRLTPEGKGAIASVHLLQQCDTTSMISFRFSQTKYESSTWMGYAYIGSQRLPIRLTVARVRNACPQIYGLCITKR